MNDPRSGSGCGDNTTAPVCSKSEGHNAIGLCDISGNVREWTWDDGPAGLDRPPRLRPKTVREGRYKDGPSGQVIAARMGVFVDGRSPAIGLRLVRSFHR
jgi:formylglycine-generating enzyme required for sulfatase activity